MNRRALAAGAAAAAALVLVRRRMRPGVSLEGAAALVTGGSRGLGFLIARELLDHGCRVAICARDAHTLERARRRLEAETGGRVEAFECDIADADAVERMVHDVVVRFGGLDVLINNAAIIQVGPVETLGVDDFRKAIDIGLMGTVHATLAALPYLEHTRGRIANITSIGGKVAVPHMLPYACAKFGAVGFSEGLRAELARTGVRVTTVVPGLMRTGSPVHVEYRGDPRGEYTWFALGDLVPLAAMSAERAARRIVRAVRRGETEVVLSWQAKLLRVAHDVAPVAVTLLLGGVNRLLPRPSQAWSRARLARTDAALASLGASALPAARSARGVALRGTLPGFVESALDRAALHSNQV